MASSATMFASVADPVPLKKWDAGSVRVTGTRIHFNIVVGLYRRDGTVQDLLEALPDLSPATAHRLVAYYLEHQSEVDAWIEQIDREADEIWEKLEEIAPTKELRARLRAQLEERRAAASQ
jgi:uncharacterized protein (DUF433 family)